MPRIGEARVRRVATDGVQLAVVCSQEQRGNDIYADGVETIPQAIHILCCTFLSVMFFTPSSLANVLAALPLCTFR